MKFVLNSFLLSLVMFVSITTGNVFLMLLYSAFQMSKAVENRVEIMDSSLAAMDNFAIPTGFI